MKDELTDEEFDLLLQKYLKNNTNRKEDKILLSIAFKEINNLMVAFDKFKRLKGKVLE